MNLKLERLSVINRSLPLYNGTQLRPCTTITKASLSLDLLQCRYGDFNGKQDSFQSKEFIFNFTYPYTRKKMTKAQICAKFAIAFVCTTCKRQLLFALLQQITIVCTSAIENIFCTTVIVNT